jgi:hypothetical protein
MNGSDFLDLEEKALAKGQEEVDREELFPERPGEDRDIRTAVDAHRAMAALKHLNGVVDDLQKERTEILATYTRWYDERESRIQRSMGFLKERLHMFLQDTRRKRFASPEGSVFYRTTSRVNWPSDEELVRWAKTTAEPAEYLRFKESPNKTAIKEAIKTGAVGSPPGYSESEETTLHVRFETVRE